MSTPPTVILNHNTSKIKALCRAMEQTLKLFSLQPLSRALDFSQVQRRGVFSELVRQNLKAPCDRAEKKVN